MNHILLYLKGLLNKAYTGTITVHFYKGTIKKVSEEKGVLF